MGRAHRGCILAATGSTKEKRIFVGLLVLSAEQEPFEMTAQAVRCGRLKVFLMDLRPVLIRPRRGIRVFWGHDESDQPGTVFLQLPFGGMGGLSDRTGRRPLSPA
jgi:hypothetical protein